MRSKKTKVIEAIFESRYNSKTGALSRSIVTFDDVAKAIRKTKVPLNPHNTANFWKDIIRSRNSNSIWPASVLTRGYTGVDAIGKRSQASFEFVPLPIGQTTAFPAGVAVAPELLTAPIELQTVSLPFAMRKLGRWDETALAQVIQRLCMVETHFALSSPREAEEILFLQTGVKLARAEIDAVYLMTDVNEDRWLISVEVKSKNEILWPTQIHRASEALTKSPMAEEVQGVIPFAVKALGKSLFYTVEFSVGAADAKSMSAVSETVFELRPAIRKL